MQPAPINDVVAVNDWLLTPPTIAAFKLAERAFNWPAPINEFLLSAKFWLPANIPMLPELPSKLPETQFLYPAPIIDLSAHSNILLVSPATIPLLSAVDVVQLLKPLPIMLKFPVAVLKNPPVTTA